ncbi:hypothetical protein OQA88_9151 [Cercophora sp. LCS_1]
MVASLLMHITPNASGYFDNMWLWVADHMIDDPLLDDANNTMTQLSVYSARGLLVESRAATWLYGTAAEHNVLWQYSFYNASNIFTTMIQTETPYFQPNPARPAPFGTPFDPTGFRPEPAAFRGDAQVLLCDKPGKSLDDPSCDASSFAVMVWRCSNIFISGAGTYSWFHDYTQDCIDQHSCQKVLWNVQENYGAVRIQHIIGIGAENVLSSSGKPISAKENLATDKHPRWAQISVFEPLVDDLPAEDTRSLAGECSLDDMKLRSNVTMPEGKYFSASYFDPSIVPPSTEFYITIVNLTPYRFRFISYFKTRMKEFEFGTVPPGKALQNKVEFGDSSNGEANFEIEGTKKTFSVRSLIHNKDLHPFRTVFDLTGMGLGQREYANPRETSSITLVISGSEPFGYFSSLNLQQGNWMRSIYPVIRQRALRHVVMPGSHDAGMSTISSVWAGGAIAANTQNQGLNVHDQLRAGSRYFDMRIANFEDADKPDPRFWAAHVSDPFDRFVKGALGQTLESMVHETNTFMDENPGEVVIWWIQYMVNIKTSANARSWDRETMARFFTELEKLKYRCTGLKDVHVPFDTLPIRRFMDQNNGRGCVLLLVDRKAEEEQMDRTDSGIYLAANNVNRRDHWADEETTEALAREEIDAMKETPRAFNNTDDTFFIMQWLSSPHWAQSTLWGLDRYALFSVNPALYFSGFNAMSPASFPTVIMQDYLGLLAYGWERPMTRWPDDIGAELQVLAIALNLYMVSLNCQLVQGRHPYNRPRRLKVVDANATEWDKDEDEDYVYPVKPFQGIIYANGSVDDNPPPGFHLDRVAVFEDGTVFSNGTVLTEDRPNPEYNVLYEP